MSPSFKTLIVLASIIMRAVPAPIGATDTAGATTPGATATDVATTAAQQQPSPPPTCPRGDVSIFLGNSDASKSPRWATAHAVFGATHAPTHHEQLAVTVASPPDGCTPLDSTKPASIPTAILIERGGCSFGTKARHAQNAGAAVVLIYNADGASMLTTAMTCSTNDCGDIVVPTLMLERCHGLDLLAEIERNNIQSSTDAAVGIVLECLGSDGSHETVACDAATTVTTSATTTSGTSTSTSTTITSTTITTTSITATLSSASNTEPETTASAVPTSVKTPKASPNHDDASTNKHDSTATSESRKLVPLWVALAALLLLIGALVFRSQRQHRLIKDIHESTTRTSATKDSTGSERAAGAARVTINSAYSGALENLPDIWVSESRTDSISEPNNVQYSALDFTAMNTVRDRVGHRLDQTGSGGLVKGAGADHAPSSTLRKTETPSCPTPSTTASQ